MTSSLSHNQTSIDTLNPHLVDEHPDVLKLLLEDKRSPNTRRAYEKDVRYFFEAIANSQPTKDIILQFFKLTQPQAIAVVLKYKSQCLQQGLAEATINRRIAAIKSLVKMGRKVNVCQFNLDDIESEKIKKYRDTSGISLDLIKKVLSYPERSTEKGIRDYAILKLLWTNALRRSEVVKTNIGDFDFDSKTLLIIGKGKGTQKEAVKLSHSTTEAIINWIEIRNELTSESPLFCSLSNNRKGKRLSGTSVYNLVNEYCKKAGISKVMSPHRIRHSAITTALDATNGDVRSVRQLSRHANIDTLMIYDDNRKNCQGELTNLLDDI